jgi:FixJ family two-component response regulator
MKGARAIVAVVDDDESVRESLPDLLDQLGFAGRTFSSAKDFLAWDGLDQTACLVLDIAMPRMSGLDLQRELQRRRQEIPIVFITAQAEAPLRPRLRDLGAVDCLRKPFSAAAFGEAVSRAVGDTRAGGWGSLPVAGPTVFVVDDDISVRESLELLIGAAGFRPQTFASAGEFLAHPHVSAPSCLVLDMSLPDLNGLELQQRLGDQQVEMPIIVITAHADVPMTVQAMKAGAVEFLTKPFADEILLGAITSALGRSRTALADAAEVQALRERFHLLSRREQQVMALVSSGLLNKQVGAELGISEITVKAHRGKVMRKMKAESLADLVNIAARLGLGAKLSLDVADTPLAGEAQTSMTTSRVGREQQRRTLPSALP